MSQERYIINSERKSVSAWENKRGDISESTQWSKIVLHDTHGVYEDQEFTCMQFAMKCAEALNKQEVMSVLP